MGLKDRLRSVKRFLKDPQGWTESHGNRMNAEYARHGTPRDMAEVLERPGPEKTEEPDKNP